MATVKVTDDTFEAEVKNSDVALFMFKDGEVVSNKTGAAPKAALQGWIEESL